ncbi:HAD-IA family hydrolase [Variovorax sp. PCZ-1]|nr:HAD-IA family hydrolase [Variovorax sp. PCZ-1]
MLNVSSIRAISFDLDDTLWPIWPVIERAEKVLLAWLGEHAPMTAALFASPTALREIREYMHDVVVKKKPEIAHDLAAIRKESIRLALYRAGDDPLLADPAFDVFFAERNRVEYYEDALPALKILAQHYPLISLSNGNAQLDRVGIAHYFKAAVSATGFGVAKPDVKIFLEAARVAGVPPEQVLHVGDDAALDVIGALGAGMQAVWLNRQDKLWPHDSIQPTLEITSLTELTALLLP